MTDDAGEGGSSAPGRLHIAVFSGDASGDLQASLLLSALRRRARVVRAWGIGGRRLQEAGMELIYDASRLSAIGFVQIARLIPDMLVMLSRARHLALQRRPDFVLAVDSGAFNLRVTPDIRRGGVPVAYWFPPGSWRRDGISTGLLEAADYFITPYPWHAENLRAAGGRADFLGHPLLDQVKPRMTAESFLERLGLPRDSRLIALLPGSRGHEVRCILPVLLEAAALLTRDRNDLSFVVPLSDHFPAGETAQIVRSQIAALKSRRLPEPRLALARSAAQETICHARAAAACSGSVTLEALVAGTPMVVVYRGTRLMKFEYKVRRMDIRYMGMPNILADAPIVPELRQDDATGPAIAAHLAGLISDGPVRSAQVQALSDLRRMLEPAGAMERTADALLQWVSGIRYGAAEAPL